MSDQTVVAESSPATPVVEVDRGPLVNWTGEQRAEFRRTGAIPEPAKKDTPLAESAPADAPEETASDDSADSAATQAQEKPNKRRPDIEARFKQYTDEIAQLKKDLEAARKPKETPAASSPARQEQPQPQQPRNYQDWRKTFTPKVWLDKWFTDHPEATDYSEGTAALSDYLDQAREHFRKVELQAKELEGRVAEARQRYPDFESVGLSIVNELDQFGKAHPAYAVIDASPVIADLLQAIGSSNKAHFMELCRTDPAKAARLALEIEREIVTQIKKDEQAAEKPPTAEEPPAKPKSNAPKPTLEVGGRAASPGDALAEAAKANDFRRFKEEANRREIARKKG